MNDLEFRDLQNKKYSSTKWRRLRRQVAEDNLYICQTCDRLFKSNQLIVHHIKHVNKHNILDDNFFYDKDNLTLTCIYCHNTEHKKLSEDCISFDETGRAVVIRERKVKKR